MSDVENSPDFEGGSDIWSVDNIESLIDCVRENPILYNMSAPEYRNTGKKDLVWQEISDSLKIEGMGF